MLYITFTIDPFVIKLVNPNLSFLVTVLSFAMWEHKSPEALVPFLRGTYNLQGRQKWLCHEERIIIVIKA